MSLAERFGIPIPEKMVEADPILVVEHQQDMRMIVAHQLNKLGFSRVMHASTGMEALEKIQETPNISVIICSGELQGMQGLELLSEIREDVKLNRPPFCIALANVNREKLMFAVETGVDEILVKPYTLGDIIPKIRRAFSLFHNPKNPEKVYELAKVHLREDKLEQAEEVFQALHESTPESARPLVGLAKVALKKKDYDNALEKLKDAEAKNPDFLHTYSLRGDIYIDQGKLDDALSWYRHAIGLSPLNPNRYKPPAEALLNAKNYAEMLEILEAGLKKGISFKEMNHYLSQGYYEIKNYTACTKYILKAVDSDPENITYLNQLALSYKVTGNLEEAKKTYNKVIKIDPDNQQALFNKAIMLSQSDKIPEAIKLLTRILDKFPNFEKAQKKLEALEAKENQK